MTENFRFDAFLSYNRTDPSAVRRLYETLCANGRSVFLDEANLAVGLPWREEISRAIGESASAAVFIGSGGLGTVQRKEVDLLLAEQDARPAFRVFAVLLPGSRNKDVPKWLGSNTWLDLRSNDPDAANSLDRAIRGEHRPAPPAPPRWRPRLRWIIPMLVLALASVATLWLVPKEKLWVGPVTVQWQDPGQWTGGQWRADGNVLEVSGASPEVLRLPGGERFGDLEFEMIVMPRAQTKSVAWLVRARDAKNYYLFRYTLPTGESRGRFEGILMRSGRLVHRCDMWLPHRPLQPGHLIHVSGAVRGAMARHELKYYCAAANPSCAQPDPHDGDDLLSTFGQPECPLDASGPATGQFGLAASSSADAFEVHRLEIRGVPANEAAK